MSNDADLFNPEMNVFELGQKIRKLDRYIGRTQARLNKRMLEYEKMTQMSAETERLLAIGLEQIDPEWSKGKHV